jgi:hypothetical protein
MKEYPGVRKSTATYKNWKKKCTHLASTHFWEKYLATTHFWEKYVTNLFPSLQIWLHELLKRSILANLASCSGNWRNIGPESHQYEIWFFQGCSRLRLKAGTWSWGPVPHLEPLSTVLISFVSIVLMRREFGRYKYKLIFHSYNIQWYHFKRDCLSSLISTSCWNWGGASWTKH